MGRGCPSSGKRPGNTRREPSQPGEIPKATTEIEAKTGARDSSSSGERIMRRTICILCCSMRARVSDSYCTEYLAHAMSDRREFVIFSLTKQTDLDEGQRASKKKETTHQWCTLAHIHCHSAAHFLTCVYLLCYTISCRGSNFEWFLSCRARVRPAHYRLKAGDGKTWHRNFYQSLWWW